MKRKAIKEIEFLEQFASQINAQNSSQTSASQTSTSQHSASQNNIKKMNEKFKQLLETISEDRWIKK